MIPYSEAYEEGFEDMRRRMPDIAKIRDTVGWAPTISLDQTLDEIIVYVRQRGGRIP
jgi:UDP-glucose 4-epimerase